MISSATSAPTRPHARSPALDAGWRLLAYGVRAVLFVFSAVLVTLEPVIRLLFLGLALVGFLTCGIFGLLLRDPHFPLGLMLGFSVLMCVLSGSYAWIVQILMRR
jgi:hypothetical protein